VIREADPQHLTIPLHSKRKVVEPEGLLDAHELAERVCGVFGCPHYEHLSIPQEVA
jgi:hypothetical protein